PLFWNYCHRSDNDLGASRAKCRQRREQRMKLRTMSANYARKDPREGVPSSWQTKIYGVRFTKSRTADAQKPCTLTGKVGRRGASMLRQVVLLSLVIGFGGGLLGAWGFASIGPTRAPSASVESSSEPSNEALPIDDASFGDAVERYLLANPDVLDRVSAALVSQKEDARRTRDRNVIASNRDAIFSSPNDPVLGNPEGDVTLVELFDY